MGFRTQTRPGLLAHLRRLRFKSLDPVWHEAQE